MDTEAEVDSREHRSVNALKNASWTVLLEARGLRSLIETAREEPGSMGIVVPRLEASDGEQLNASKVRGQAV